MTVTPDTQQDPAEPTDQEEALYSAVATTLEDITGAWREDDNARMLQALRDPIADIVRHAVADALRDQARGFERRGTFNRSMQRAHEGNNKPESADIYRHYADSAYRLATVLRTAADDKIAEGYEFECAAGWDQCETRVPDAGDFCKQHEPEDEEDRWAE